MQVRLTGVAHWHLLLERLGSAFSRNEDRVRIDLGRLQRPKISAGPKQGWVTDNEAHQMRHRTLGSDINDLASAAGLTPYIERFASETCCVQPVSQQYMHRHSYITNHVRLGYSSICAVSCASSQLLATPRTATQVYTR